MPKTLNKAAHKAVKTKPNSDREAVAAFKQNYQDALAELPSGFVLSDIYDTGFVRNVERQLVLWRQSIASSAETIARKREQVFDGTLFRHREPDTPCPKGDALGTMRTAECGRAIAQLADQLAACFSHVAFCNDLYGWPKDPTPFTPIRDVIGGGMVTHVETGLANLLQTVPPNAELFLKTGIPARSAFWRDQTASIRADAKCIEKDAAQILGHLQT